MLNEWSLQQFYSMADCDDGASEGPQEPGSRTIKTIFRLEIVTDVQQLLSLKPHWDDLCHRSIDYNFSQSFQWCLASWNIMVPPQQRRLYCLVGWLDNRIVLMWPFVNVRHGSVVDAPATGIGHHCL